MIGTYCYLDESGIHKDAEACIVAGYFGSIRQWKNFGRPWKRILNRFGVPLDEFHAKNLVKCQGFFRDWTKDKSEQLQLALAELISRCKIYPVAQGVLVESFFRMSLNERRFLTGATLTPQGRIKESGSPNKPYFAPFQPIMKRVLSYVSAGKGHFFFGLDRPFSEYAIGLYAKLKGNEAHPYQARFGDIAFPQAKQTPALQAADFLVYLTYSHMLERMKARNWYINPPRVVKLLHTNIRDKADLCYQDEKCLRDTLKGIPTEQLGDLLVDDLAS
jgi:hypothetical protein